MSNTKLFKEEDYNDSPNSTFMKGKQKRLAGWSQTGGIKEAKPRSKVSLKKNYI